MNTAGKTYQTVEELWDEQRRNYEQLRITTYPGVEMQRTGHAPTGWRCPVCGSGNAPFVSTCPNCRPPMTVTCGGMI